MGQDTGGWRGLMHMKGNREMGEERERKARGEVVKVKDGAMGKRARKTTREKTQEHV